MTKWKYISNKDLFIIYQNYDDSASLYYTDHSNNDEVAHKECKNIFEAKKEMIKLCNGVRPVLKDFTDMSCCHV